MLLEDPQNVFPQHLGDRGDAARKNFLLKGETSRRRFGIPMFISDVN